MSPLRNGALLEDVFHWEWFEDLPHHLISRLLVLLLGYSRDVISRLLTPYCLASPPQWTLALWNHKLQ